jgi:hypothetical protein
VYIGDTNGDTIFDLVIGAPGVGFGAGAVYVLYGKSIGVKDIVLNELLVNDGYMIQGISISDFFGMSVSGAG